MDNKAFGKYLELRTKDFAVRVIRLSAGLPFNVESKVVRFQFTKSGTSVGANYREANRARSRADFANKIKICESEANETVFWLEIIENMNWIPIEILKPVLQEANELLAIFTSIAKGARS